MPCFANAILKATNPSKFVRNHLVNFPQDMLWAIIDRWSCFWFYRNEFLGPDSIIFSVDPIFRFIIECVINRTFKEYNTLIYRMHSKLYFIGTRKLTVLVEADILTNPIGSVNKRVYSWIALLIFELIPSRVWICWFVVDEKSIIACIINTNINWFLFTLFK